MRALCLPLLLSIAAVSPAPAIEPEASREAIERFARVVQAGDAAGLRSLLPERGTVHLRMTRLGARDGPFSAGQVEAIFRDAFDRGAVRTVELLRAERDDAGQALSRVRAEVVDPSGRKHPVTWHVRMQAEGGRWVLREIRESTP